MTDKQIRINGVDVAECPHRKKEVTFMNVIKCYNYGACEGVNCLYKQLKRKEQECEKLKKIINEAKNSKLDLKSFLVCEAVQNEYEQQLDQLNAENEELKEQIKKEIETSQKWYQLHTEEHFAKLQYKEALTEIKEIAKNMNNECFCFDFDCKDCDMKNGCTYFSKKQILQKIREYEVKNGRN